MEDPKSQSECTEPIKESASSSKDLSKSLPEEAFNNFLQGKRHMLVQDYTFAVQSLATACELYVKHFGELALECGEVYFLYGKALFRLSQQQAGILGDALNEGSNEDDDEKSSEESKENESEKNASDTEGGEDNQEDVDKEEEEKEPSESTDSPQAVVEDPSKDTEMKENEPNSSSADSSVSEVPKGNQELKESNSDLSKSHEDTEGNQENEEDDLELAWNTLETAKTIFKRQGEDNIEAQLKIAEILVLLAEISMESGNNVAAINDLKECLAIQECHLSSDDRSLAETYYQMGLALSNNKQHLEALDNFRTTMRILQLRIENIKKKPVPDSIGTFAAADQEIEISDLETVLLDIKEKIEDTEEQRKIEKKLEEALANASKDVSSTVDIAKSSSKPISNITHLLKRKKPESVTDGKEIESKRLKISSNLPNGDTAVLPDTTTGSET